MKRSLLLMLFAFAFCSVQSQSNHVQCPGDTVIILYRGCDSVLTIANPGYSSTDPNAKLNWFMQGATQGSSIFSPNKINYVGTRKFSAGYTVILYRLTWSGGVDSCFFTVLLRESIPPTISCPGNITSYTSGSACSRAVATSQPTASDNCRVARIKWTMKGATTMNSGDEQISYVGTKTFNRGITTVTYTVLDWSGDSAKCSFKVTVLDTLPPQLRCPGNVVAYTGHDSCSKLVTPEKPSYSDVCGISSLTWSMTGANTGMSPADGINVVGSQLFNLGITTITYTAKDSSGNTATCSFTVSVRDTVRPVISNFQDTIRAIAGNGCSKNVFIPTLKFSDNCQGATLSWGMTGATNRSGTGQIGTASFGIGTTTVMDTVRDGSGNFALCKFKVIVSDTTKPTLHCLPSRTDTITNGNCAKSITLPNPSFSDNCSDGVSVYWKISGATTAASPVTGKNFIGTQRFNIGVSKCTYYVKDAAGNVSTCMFSVKVVELTPPVITCKGDVSATSTTCTKSVFVPSPNISDNCSIQSLSWKMTGATVKSSPKTGINNVGTKVFNSGVTVIAYTLKDLSGNIATCKQNVTVTSSASCFTAAKGIETAPSEVFGLGAELYPNPSHENFSLRIKSMNNDPAEITVYSSEGKKIEQFRSRPSQEVRFGDKYSKGTYFIKIRQGSQQYKVTGIKL